MNAPAVPGSSERSGLRLEPVSHRDLDTDGPFLQTGFWAELKIHHEWQALGFRLWTPLGPVPLLVLLKTLPLGYVLAYVPHGPQGEYFLSDSLESKLADLGRQLRSYLPANTLFLRFDLLSGTSRRLDFSKEREESEAQAPDSRSPAGPAGEVASAEAFPPPLKKPLVKPVMDIQPPDTVIVDLRPGLDGILSAMKKKTRYNIRLFQKKGLAVTEGSIAELPEWYELYKETARRDKIAVHEFGYYKSLFDLAFTYGAGAPVVKLLLVRHEGRLVAGNVLLVHGKQGVYLYGASSNDHRPLMSTYGLQWHAIELCKSLGAETYDLFGVPPRDDPAHPMHGLYRFKVGFGGTLVHRQGSWDLPFKPLMYHLYFAAERVRFWYFKKFKKR